MQFNDIHMLINVGTCVCFPQPHDKKIKAWLLRVVTLDFFALASSLSAKNRTLSFALLYCVLCVFLFQNSQTPLTAAVRKGSIEIVNILLDKGADPNHKAGDLVSNKYTV